MSKENDAFLNSDLVNFHLTFRNNIIAAHKKFTITKKISEKIANSLIKALNIISSKPGSIVKISFKHLSEIDVASCVLKESIHLYKGLHLNRKKSNLAKFEFTNNSVILLNKENKKGIDLKK